jgi:hypothetical protein
VRERGLQQVPLRAPVVDLLPHQADTALKGLDLTHATTHTHMRKRRVDEGKRVYLYVSVCVCLCVCVCVCVCVSWGMIRP